MNSDKAKKTASQKSNGSLFANRGSEPSGNSFDWGGVDSARLAKLIELVTGRGGAIRFGYSRDGSAGSIGVYYGDDRDTLYIRPNGDIEETFGLIERTFETLPYSGGKSPTGAR